MQVDFTKIDEMISRYSVDKSAVIQVLQDIQVEFKYLPKEALEYVSDKLDIPLSHTFNVATFYKTFSMEPKGENHVCVCLGTACHVMGANRILDHLCDDLGIEEGKTTADGKFSIERVNCVGACALGPIVINNGKYNSHMNLDKSLTLLKKLGKAPKEEAC